MFYIKLILSLLNGRRQEYNGIVEVVLHLYDYKLTLASYELK